MLDQMTARHGIHEIYDMKDRREKFVLKWNKEVPTTDESNICRLGEVREFFESEAEELHDR